MAKLDTLKVFKQGVGMVVGAGVSNIVNEFVKRVAPTDTLPQKVLVFSGRIGIGMLVSDAVKEHLDMKIDEANEWFKTNFTK